MYIILVIMNHIHICNTYINAYVQDNADTDVHNYSVQIKMYLNKREQRKVHPDKLLNTRLQQ